MNRRVPADALHRVVAPVVALSGMSVATSAWSEPASSEPPALLAVGGELRERFESTRNPVFGLPSPSRRSYLLHRAVIFAEARIRTGVRARLELASGTTSNWDPPAQATQEDPLDVLQAFIETSMHVSGQELSARVGRQEVALGSARLVSNREGTSIRRVFDGVRVSASIDGRQAISAFVLRPVIPATGVFDDHSSAAQRFWGVYFTRWSSRLVGAGFDAYYLGLDRESAPFAHETAREKRHTIGVRVFGERSGLEWNGEAAWQGGTFGHRQIRAWTVSMDAGFRLTALPLAPRLGLKVDAISGDRDPGDGHLDTFNPLFPKLPYFSDANLATPANLLDVQPSVRLAASPRLSVTVSWNGLWKHAREDAFYAPVLLPVAGTRFSAGRHIGWQASAQVDWAATDRMQLTATCVTFDPRSVIRETGGKPGRFFAATLRWNFR